MLQTNTFRFFTQLLTYLSISFLASCAVPVPLQKHTVMGSEQTGYSNLVLTLQTETETPSFHIKLFTIRNAECVKASMDYVEFDGAINKESLSAFEAVLIEAQGCKNRKGTPIYPFVYLNSSTGDYPDGYTLGEMFRKFNIETVVTQGQTCKGACAVAFLGGRLRLIRDNGALVFASNKVRGIGIECERANNQVMLRNYLERMLGVVYSEPLYFNLMSNCFQPNGLSLDRNTANELGVANEK